MISDVLRFELKTTQFFVWFLLTAMASTAYAGSLEELKQKRWIHGSEDCLGNDDPAIDVYRFDDATYILRQNMCVNYEAPFIYLLFGEHTVLVLDTGATSDPTQFPLYETIGSLINHRRAKQGDRQKNLLVAHSHSHADHKAADSQFREQPYVTLIEPTQAAMQAYFQFDQWPNGTATIDLGGRVLTVIPTPGHHDESITIFDSATKWLLTGDSVYPGRLYIKNWSAYKSSIRRLVEISATLEISAVMGSHIEMSSRPGVSFPLGSTHHPMEAGLALSVEDLSTLNRALDELGDEPVSKSMPKYVIRPLSSLEVFLGWALGKLGFGG